MMDDPKHKYYFMKVGGVSTIWEFIQKDSDFDHKDGKIIWKIFYKMKEIDDATEGFSYIWTYNSPDDLAYPISKEEFNLKLLEFLG
jgi:hypothetical protein